MAASMPLVLVLIGLGAAAATWAMLKFARVMDVPNHRSAHQQPVPRGGGVAIVAAWGCGMLLLAQREPAMAAEPWFLALAASGLLVAGISLADDLYRLDARLRLGVQAAAAVLFLWMSGFDAGVPDLGLPGLGWVGLPLSLLWLLGLANAYNFMDGLDGLAGGVAVLTAGFFALIAALAGHGGLLVLSACLMAGALGFTVFNFPPARIIMGDVGAVFLGFAFAALALIGAEAADASIPIWVMPLLLLHFIYDTAYTFLRRWRAGEPVLQSHRTHLYQLLQRSGASHRQVTLLHYAMVILQGGCALWLLTLPPVWYWLPFLPCLLVQATYTRLVRWRSRETGVAESVPGF